MVQATERILALRPPRILERLGEQNRLCLLSSREIFGAVKGSPIIIMACNTRIRHAIPGILRAAQELDAVVAFELAKSEGDVDGGYTGQDPATFFETVVDYAEGLAFDRPFFIHGDHITVKDGSEKALASARRLIRAEMEAGYTSFAIDASFNELEENIRITTELAREIQKAGYGLEVEVGEIKSTGTEAEITTVEEAEAFIRGLNDNGIHPSLLAINNGSKHGNYLEGEPVHIDLERTGAIFEAIKPFGVAIAQHGITGTPLHLVGRFADFGIRKGNVGTQWQNIAHAGLPQDLMAAMKEWAAENKKDIKFATKPFKGRIDGIPPESRDGIAEESYRAAKEFIEAFRAKGSGSMVLRALGA
jgi:fructose-bisphosphate aldolase class II